MFIRLFIYISTSRTFLEFQILDFFFLLVSGGKLQRIAVVIITNYCYLTNVGNIINYSDYLFAGTKKKKKIANETHTDKK